MLAEQGKDTRLLLLVSHDMNILYLRQLLGINWVPFGYSDGIATTAGALLFDVYQSTADQLYYVKVFSFIPCFQSSHTVLSHRSLHLAGAL